MKAGDNMNNTEQDTLVELLTRLRKDIEREAGLIRSSFPKECCVLSASRVYQTLKYEIINGLFIDDEDKRS